MDNYETLEDALPKQIARVQGIIALYNDVPNGQLAARMMQSDVNIAHKAILEGNLAGMIAAYKSLLEWKDT